MIIQTTYFTPECSYCRSEAPNEGLGCFRIIIHLPHDQMTTQDTWLEPHELHCPFDPEWREEKVEIFWKELGRGSMPDEMAVIERCSKERAEREKWRSET